MLEIIVRCGYGELNELGTGHLNRSLNIIKFLKKIILIQKNIICFK